MDILNANQKPWKEIKEIYIEAFPKSERKPFFTVRRSVNKGKALLLTAMENEALRGFVLVIPYKNMVMVEPEVKLCRKYVGIFPAKKSFC